MGSERPVLPGAVPGAAPTPPTGFGATANSGPPPPNQGAPMATPDASMNAHPRVPPMHPAMAARTASKDEEDTMRNLRKTFAGIFGDM